MKHHLQLTAVKYPPITGPMLNPTPYTRVNIVLFFAFSFNETYSSDGYKSVCVSCYVEHDGACFATCLVGENDFHQDDESGSSNTFEASPCK